MLSTILARVDENRFGEWFRKELKQNGYSQRAFAKRAGVSTSAVSEWIRGHRKPDPPYCDIIADVLLVDRDFVLDLAGHRTFVDELAPDDPRFNIIAKVKLLDPNDESSMRWLETFAPAIDSVIRQQQPRKGGNHGKKGLVTDGSGSTP